MALTLVLALHHPFSVRGQVPTFEWASLLTFQDPPHHAIDTQVDRDGNVIVAHYNWDNWATSLTTSKTWSDHVVLKLDPAGNLLWQLAVLPNISKLAVDAAGNTYVAGSLLRGHPNNPVMPATYFTSRGISTTGNGTAYVARIAPGGELEWVRLDGGAAVADANDVAIAADGSYFMAGIYTRSAATFGSTVLPAPLTTRARNAFVAKYAADGTLEWIRPGESADENVFAGQIALGPGNSLFLNWNGATINFGPGGEAISGSPLIRFSSSGDLLWAKPQGSFVTRIATDAEGNAFVTKRFDGLVLAKFNPDGTLLWERRPEELDPDFVNYRALAVNARGDAYAAGYFESPRVNGVRQPSRLTFGTHTVTTMATDGFVVKFDSTGKPMWLTQTFNRDGDTEIRALACDPRGGGLAILGGTRGTVELGNTLFDAPDAAAGGRGVFVARLAEPVPVTVELKVTRTDSGLMLSWPTTSSGFVLEKTGTLGADSWAAVAGTPVVEGGRNVMTLEVSGTGEFYRLRRP